MPYYPKPAQRPRNFRLNTASPLYRGLVFAGLGQHCGSTFFHDESPQKNHGTLTGYGGAGNTLADQWGWDASLRRSVLGFDGSGDSITCGSSGFPTGTLPHTVAGWFKQRADGQAIVASWGMEIARQGRWFAVNLADLGNQMGQSFWDDGNGSGLKPPNGRWNHIAWLYFGGTSVGYVVNGGTLISGTVAYVPSMQPGPLRIGCLGDFGYHFPGWIADLMVCNRVLSPSEIAALADPGNVDLRVNGVPLILPVAHRASPVVRWPPRFLPVSAAGLKVFGSDLIGACP